MEITLDTYFTELEASNKLQKLKDLRLDYQSLFYDKHREDITVSEQEFFSGWNEFLLGKLEEKQEIRREIISGDTKIMAYNEIFDTKAKITKLAKILFEKYGIDQIKTLLHLSKSPVSNQSDESTTSSFVSYSLETYSIQFDKSGGLIGRLFSKDLIPVRYDDLLNRLFVDADRSIELNGTQIKKEYIKNHLDNSLCEIIANKRNNLKQVLKYTGANIPAVEKTVRLLLKYGKIPATNANVEMMKHFLWSIKRKIYSKTIPFPVFFSFFSRKMGVGKSYFVKDIVSSLFTDLVNADAKIHHLLTDNDRKALVDGVVLCDFQELTLPDKFLKPDGTVSEEVLETLKTTITADYFSGRQMYSANSAKVFNGSVFCSSTNKHIFDVVHDENGMRRYWEFNWGLESSTEFDTELTNLVLSNMLELWQNIDENFEEGYYHASNPHYNEIIYVQSLYRYVPPIEQFMVENGITMYPEYQEGLEIESKQTFFELHFRPWIESEGRTWTLAGMDKAIRKRYDIKPVPYRFGSVVKPCYFFKTESQAELLAKTPKSKPVDSNAKIGLMSKYLKTTP